MKIQNLQTSLNKFQQVLQVSKKLSKSDQTQTSLDHPLKQEQSSKVPAKSILNLKTNKVLSKCMISQQLLKSSSLLKHKDNQTKPKI